MEITLGQTLFTSNLRCIAHPQLVGAKPEDECCQELHQLYMSLFCAIAYFAHARPDIVVSICAFRRHAHTPQ
eukprot:624378-Lingulodinium_polyedra.AAC.1